VVFAAIVIDHLLYMHVIAVSAQGQGRGSGIILGSHAGASYAGLQQQLEIRMATIRKLRGRWQVQVRRRGMKPRAKSFNSKAEAEK
jgi:hypothetical protein